MKSYNLLGWVGVVFILVAYALVSLQIVYSGDIVYILLNILGSLGLIFSSFHKKDSQPVVLNIIWLLVAFVGLIKFF